MSSVLAKASKSNVATDNQRLMFMGGYVEIMAPNRPVFRSGLWEASSFAKIVACDEECQKEGIKILEKHGYKPYEGDSTRFIKTVMFSFTDLDLDI